ncbi:MAG: hypothetical protein WCP29_07845 [Acidobacteriota bacterium]
MSHTTEGVLKFPLAVSCFAAQRMLGVLPLVGEWEPVRSAQRTLYEAGEAAKKDFSTNTMMFGAFQFGDKAQSVMATLASDAISLKVMKPSYVMRMMSDVMKGSRDAIGAVASSQSRGLLREQFQNTGDVIGFVNHSEAPSTLSADGSYPIDEQVAACYARGDYPALWLVEGLGERYADAYLAGDKPVRDLLTAGEGGALPEKTRLMMHAGIGIAFAKHSINALTPFSKETDVLAALNVFLELVRDNSMPGYEGAALESLGLVTRTWYPQLVRLVAEHMLALDVDAWEFFWHGAGRAMYFSPMYMLPGLSAWDAAEQEPPDDTARLNARAGVAWAFTIVNVRQPGIAANFLRHQASRADRNEAYTNGVYSTLIMAGDTVPGHQYIAEFCAFKPEAHEPDLVEAWTKHIGADPKSAIDGYRAALKAHGKLGEVLRYHDLRQLVADLDA